MDLLILAVMVDLPELEDASATMESLLDNPLLYVQ